MLLSSIFSFYYNVFYPVKDIWAMSILLSANASTLYLICRFWVLPIQQQIKTWCQKYYKWGYNYLSEWKTLWEKEKLLVTSNFFFSHNVFKSCLYLMRQNEYLWSKELSLVKSKILSFNLLPHYQSPKNPLVRLYLRVQNGQGRVIILTSDNQKPDFMKYSIFSPNGESCKLQIFTRPNQILPDQNVTTWHNSMWLISYFKTHFNSWSSIPAMVFGLFFCIGYTNHRAGIKF